MINPAGISGEASSGEKRFLVQTEFAPRPKPRITTSISLNGEVVQKVENLWEKLPQSEEDRYEIERFLKKQHFEVIKNIEEKKEGFLLSKEKKTALASEKPPEQTTFIVDKKVLRLLIEAINLVAKGVVKIHGSYWATQNLRKTKERIVKEFPFVANFYVDNSATISLIKGEEKLLNESLSFAVTKWIYLFMSSANLKTRISSQTQPPDIRDLTADLSQPLEQIGFYSTYQKFAES
jgi:hypothetical protein